MHSSMIGLNEGTAMSSSGASSPASPRRGSFQMRHNSWNSLLNSPDMQHSKKYYQVQPIVKGKRVDQQCSEHKSDTCKDSKGLFVSHVNLLIAKRINKESTLLAPGINCVLYPMGSFRQKWDLAILILLVYVALLTPLQIAFFEQDFAKLNEWLGWFIMDLIVDLMFIFDIALNFRTAWMSKDPEDYGRYLFNQNEAALRYFKGWFAVDLLSVIPFYFIDIYLLYSDVPASAASSIVRVPKMLKLVRLAKLLRVLRASQIFKRWDRWMAQRIQIGCTKLFRSMLLFIWLLHLMACLWFFASSFEDDIRIAWMSELPAQQQQNAVDLYLASLHWAAMTLTTIGYGDIVPISATERVICFIGQLMGVLVSAYVIGTVVLLVQSFVRRSTDFQRSMDAMQDILKSAGINDKMRKRCTTYCFYAQEQRKSYNDLRDVRSAMHMFSPALKADLAYEVYRKTLHDFDTFQDMQLPRHMLKQICLNFEPVVYGPHEYIARKDHLCHCAYFVTRGKLQLEHWTNHGEHFQPRPPPQISLDMQNRDHDFKAPEQVPVAGYEKDVYTKILRANCGFGTPSLFWQCYWYFYYRALGFCEMLLLRAGDFRKLRTYKEFPESYRAFKRATIRYRWRQLFQCLIMIPQKRLQHLANELVLRHFIQDSPAQSRGPSPHQMSSARSDNNFRAWNADDASPPTNSNNRMPRGSAMSASSQVSASNNRGVMSSATLAHRLDALTQQQSAMQKQLKKLLYLVGESKRMQTESCLKDSDDLQERAERESTTNMQPSSSQSADPSAHAACRSSQVGVNRSARLVDASQASARKVALPTIRQNNKLQFPSIIEANATSTLDSPVSEDADGTADGGTSRKDGASL